MISQPEDLARIQLHHVLHDVVMRDLIPPPLKTRVMEEIIAKAGPVLSRIAVSGGIRMGGIKELIDGIRLGRPVELVVIIVVVEVDVEGQLVTGVRVAFAELALHRTVAGTDVVPDDLGHDETQVFDLR